MKLCIDCKHYIVVGASHYCGFYVYSAPDPVIGGTMIKGTHLFCREERALDGERYCGPEGKHWEAKDA